MRNLPCSFKLGLRVDVFNVADALDLLEGQNAH